ncbi:MAG: acetyl-CoA carboxylase biotin carboxyl carrier protein subunit [Gemmatimonadetes bacterium]|nr:acetyl-CoA carboxylase biotin carboxyl carrier protein subunit [Gemmatimonadota bacterium]
MQLSYLVTIQGTTYTVSLDDREGQIVLSVDGRSLEIDMASIQGDQFYSLLIDGRSYTAVAATQGEQREVKVNGVSSAVAVEDEELARLRSQVKPRRRVGGDQIKAPMPGRIVSVSAVVGDTVEAGQGVVVIEAMKMENELRAHAGGTVKEIRVGEGDTVDKNTVLVVIGD